MKKRYRRRRPPSRSRRRFGASKWSPFVKLFGAVFGVLAGIALLMFFVMLLLEAVFKVDTPLSPEGFSGKLASLLNVDKHLVVTPTPYVPPKPSPTPHPMDVFDGEAAEVEIVIPVDMQYTWFADPFCFNNKVIFSAGRVIDGKALLTSLLQFSVNDRSVLRLPITPQNDHLLFPVHNDRWLVYFDASFDGGGDIYFADITNLDAGASLLKHVYIGQPELKLDGDYIAWVERTGTDRDKLFVCDLNTQETTTLQIFDKSGYGTSIPFLYNNTLIWAFEDEEYNEDGRETSVIRYASLDGSGINDYRPQTYVHDPEGNGKYFAWLDSPHRPGTNLYLYDGKGSPKRIDSGVVEFGFSDNFIAYGKDSAVYIYVFGNQKTYRLSPSWETTQFLGVSGSCVFWMDVTSREQDVIKYVKLPI